MEMPHIRSLMTQAYVRMAAMKLYAYRALDYVRAASGADRRYLLFCAVQKAKVSTEGVKVMALLSECIGAKGFESDTYFEMALRDIQLFPGLEGSTHINLALTTQFLPQYFSREQHELRTPDSSSPSENPYLMRARAGAINTIEFAPYLRSYQPLMSVPNVRCLARQVTRLDLFFRGPRGRRLVGAGLDAVMDVGRCLATIAYAELIAESAIAIAPELISIMFGFLVRDLTDSVLTLASSPHLNSTGRVLIQRAVVTPRFVKKDLHAVSQQMATC
jgi:acyl-CoA dehydrogenase